MQLDQLYQEVILDHYRNPHGRGLREPFDAQVHHVNPTCGDEITLRVRLRGAGEEAVVDDVSFDNIGCSISQASASVLHDQIVGQTVAHSMLANEEFTDLMHSGIRPVNPDEELIGDGVAFSGVAKYPARVKCALLAWMAFRDAVARATAAHDVDLGMGPQSLPEARS